MVAPRLMQLTDQMHDKRCRNCGEVKPLSAYHRDRYCPDGRKSACKPCVNAHRREQAAKRRPPCLNKPRFDPDTEQWCPACQAVKPLDAFGRDRHRANGHKVQCTSCENARLRAWSAKKRAASLPPRPAGVDPATEKWCPQCQVVKPFASFHKDRRTADGYYLYCRSCHGLNVRNGFTRKRSTQRTSHRSATPQARRVTP